MYGLFLDFVKIYYSLRHLISEPVDNIHYIWALNYYNIKITLESNVVFVLITSLINSLLHISYVGRGNLGIDMPP